MRSRSPHRVRRKAFCAVPFALWTLSSCGQTLDTPNRLGTGSAPTYATDPLPSSSSIPDPAYNSPGPGWVLGGAGEKLVNWIHLPSRAQRGKNVVAWQIINNRATERSTANEGQTSFRILTEFDCRQHKQRVTEATIFSALSAKGNVLLNAPGDPSPWQSTAPGSIGEIDEKVACQHR